MMTEEYSGETRSVRLPLAVEILEAKPNKMFTEDMRQLIRFLHYTKAVACAECGKKKKRHWTMLCSFQATSMGAFVLTRSGKVHRPLTPVCGAHPLAPETEPA